MIVLSCESKQGYVRIYKEGKLYVVRNSKYNEDNIKFINYTVAKEHYNLRIKEVMNVVKV